MTAFYVIKIFVLLSSVLDLSVSTAVLIGNCNWTVIPAPEGRPLQSITISANYLWGIEADEVSSTVDVHAIIPVIG